MSFRHRFRRKQMPSFTAHSRSLFVEVRPDSDATVAGVAGRSLPRDRRPAKRLSLSKSRARVKAIIDRSQPRFEDVRVDLRRRQIRVPEHQLDRAEVGAALEEMSRE